MQTVNEFIEKKNLKESHGTVVMWCVKGYIPGAKKEKIDNREKWVIPDCAKVPFTNTRARRAGKVNLQILKACNLDMRPVSDVFKIDDLTLKSYIDGLIEEKLIRQYVDDSGIEQYTITSLGSDKLKDENLLLRFLDKLAEGTGAAAGTAVVQKFVGNFA